MPARLPNPRPSSSSTLNFAVRSVFHHLKRHVGVGAVCAVAYFDPKSPTMSVSVDLQAGANFGYRPMLFVLLISGIGAMLLQTLACKLGCVTGIDLASHCRLLLHDHPTHPRLVRRLVMYPLYAFAEIAIISTDLAELLGSAIGICLIFPSLPLWAGVVLTALDVFVFLLFSDPSRGGGRPVRTFEFIIMALVFTIFACLIVLLVRVHPNWASAFRGYIPSEKLFLTEPNAIYAAVGILGATIMPHALFLGSFLGTQDREAFNQPPSSVDLPGPSSNVKLAKTLKTYFTSLFRVTPAERAAAARDYRSRYGERENNSLSFVKGHLNHLVLDVCSSILTLAVPINSAILIMSATVFYKLLRSENEEGIIIGLFDAHTLIKTQIGSASAFLFALALVLSGQSASVTATFAGQLVGEGFIEWRVTPFFRRLITRSISLVPSLAVAAAIGRNGIDNLLIISQVILSIVLPFVAFPLIYLTSSKVVMRVKRPSTPPLPPPPPSSIDTKTCQEPLEDSSVQATVPAVPSEGNDNSIHEEPAEEPISPSPPIVDEKVAHNFGIEDCVDAASIDEPEYVDYSNSLLVSIFAYLVWCVILVANVYAMVAFGLDQT
ncbi:hypothetical protein D9757_006220 [Collybiopsis confluens]|uniref:Natural resistance-associated macrophage protein n=1 Tax=Collybiopsis confluens TaxID=2823264 RepID=A0A8H5HJW2_9AGAR|nr:hypothetical protein D9757_006220 [Collybiopsis confluens]